MKLFKMLLVLVTLAVALTPIAAVGTKRSKTQTQNETSSSGTGSTSAEETTQAEKSEEKFKILLSASGEVVEMMATEYIVGVLAAEMPMTYHEEALKAQALASYTFAVRQKHLQAKEPEEALKGAHLSDKSSSYQGYYTKEVRQEKWGDKFETYEKRALAAAESVGGRLICCDGEPIMAAFHSICSGKTESAETVWGKDISYLRSVESVGDKLSPDYSSSLVLTAEQFSEKAKALEGVELPENSSDWVGKISSNSGGFVKTAEIGGKKYSGTQVREAFGLRSANFTIKYENEKFTFNVTGYGHSVGMSQYGADYMARQGSNAQEILEHYYAGTEII